MTLIALQLLWPTACISLESQRKQTGFKLTFERKKKNAEESKQSFHSRQNMTIVNFHKGRQHKLKCDFFFFFFSTEGILELTDSVETTEVKHHYNLVQF